MMKVLRYLVILSAALFVLSCTKKESTYKQYDLNGIRITENSTTPADTTLRIELKEAATISLETETGYIQPPDYDYHFDTSGNLYFVDYKTNKIHKYDTKGGSAAVFGGKGQGPGEFSVQPRIFVSGDTLYAAETNIRKVTKFDLNGKYLSEKIIPDID
ncbi:MAG: 6-bladed beta-propeller, partial [Candidatus Delongbacteria bacterium]